jgi:hypothetical protein
MAKPVITIEEVAELRRLDAELLNALKRVSGAMQTEQPGHSLEGEALARVDAARKTVAEIKRRIKEIRGG